VNYSNHLLVTVELSIAPYMKMFDMIDFKDSSQIHLPIQFCALGQVLKKQMAMDRFT
jgi:hypothetical protein